MQKDADASMQHVEKVRRKAIAFLQALRMQYAESSKAVRKSGNQAYYAKRRVIDALVTGKFASYSKVIGEYLYEDELAIEGGGFTELAQYPRVLNGDVQLNVSENFDATRVALWTEGDSEMVQTFARFLDSSADKPADRRDALESAIVAKKWAGGVARVRSLCEADWPLLDATLYEPKHSGASGWIFMSVRNMWRIGPGSFPLTGYSSLTQVFDKPMIMVLHPVKCFLDRGISLPDVYSFLCYKGLPSVEYASVYSRGSLALAFLPTTLR